MKLEKQLYLVLERVAPSSHTLQIVADLRDVVSNWKSSTRVSPIFPIVSPHSGVKSGSLAGANSVLLVGPVHPEKLASILEKNTQMWATFGLLNLLICPDSQAEQNKLIRYAKDHDLSFECYKLGKNGSILSSSGSHTGTVGPPGNHLAKLLNRSYAPEVRDALYEYCPLIASSLSRAAVLPSDIRGRLASTNDFIAKLVTEAAAEDTEVTPYRLLGQLLTINAGLSRFSSQTFAGTVPIAETECHFWSHSLLGIGVASLGLWRLTRFLEETLGNARLPERFAKLAERREDVPNLCELDINDSFWANDHLGNVALSNGETAPIIPLLAYFSARDGFRSTLTTISAPLSSVTSCNSPRWSLLTVTHEASHVLVQGMLAALYPNPEDKKEIARTVDLLNKKQGDNLLEEIRRFLLITICSMNEAHSDNEGEIEIDREMLGSLIEHWRRETEEILVHVFDFLYFYGKDVEKYVSGLWASWGTIPNISTRIPDYVVRTISTVLANHLRRPKSEETARDHVVRVLKDLQRHGMGGDYVKAAQKYIRDHWDDEIYERVIARKGLVKIAQTFFFSDTVATAVRGEPEISGRASEKEGYTLKVGELTQKAIRNPLRFLELYSVATQASALESLWIYYVLAFCVAG